MTRIPDAGLYAALGGRFLADEVHLAGRPPVARSAALQSVALKTELIRLPCIWIEKISDPKS